MIKANRTHEFTLILSGFSELTEEVMDAIYEAGCDDGLLCLRSGVPFIEFDRESPSLKEAVLSAIADVEKAGFRAVRVEPDDLVTAAEISRRTGRTRESIRKLISGERGPRGFPAPISSITSKSPIWRWANVAAWFAEHGLDVGADAPPLENAGTIALINAALELHRHVPTTAGVAEIWRRLNRKRREKIET